MKTKLVNNIMAPLVITCALLTIVPLRQPGRAREVED